ncbi:hypothetical protein FIU97_13730 [Roseivivax sp. THAF40]|uniref:hypothetical protein n=1 Tax=unclassified Roseivivax TaxID=2639302 RepID=UPI0012694EE7|nr:MULTISPECIES: hypothetical protein [unclassified Roseivivax]QFS83803.1 hypothetical protein FIV09_13290 [Roseivivax sp. THAF197b]QFT47635.1 hypothetical protein FIU97_13730 [Roseivivax sp. THAF40]
MSDPDDRPVSPVFFERRTYRRRRLQDAARILPVIGAFAWLIPLLWPRGSEDGPPMSQALIYMFTVWVLLIVIGAILSRKLTAGDAAEAERSQE